MSNGQWQRLWLSPMMILSVFSFSGWVQLLEGSCIPRAGCSRALAYYLIQEADTLYDLATRFGTTVAEVQNYNTIPYPDSLHWGDGSYLLFPFPCECQGSHLGHNFEYEMQLDDTFFNIAANNFPGLTTADLIQEASNLQNVIDLPPGTELMVPVNCSCGNPSVSDVYGLFTTYPAQSTDSVLSLAQKFGISEELLREYNPSPDSNGNLTSGTVLFVPTRDALTNQFPPYNATDNGSDKSNKGLIIGISVGGGVAVIVTIMALAWLFFVFLPRRRDPRKGVHHGLEVAGPGQGSSQERRSGTDLSRRQSSSQGLLRFSGFAGGSGRPEPLPEFTVDKSLEFSYEELRGGTNNFNVANKIGEGGYGAVFLANLRGQKLAVKRMNLQATREFLAEIQVLTRVHHTNLVQLVGYCTVESLFLIYEYVDNGTLDRHLLGSHGLPPLAWPVRVQIALDAARGLEYIHEHTKPTYIHRDVKSSNILIDKQFHAKVADFGLTKLTESGVGNSNVPTRLVGTFGYMSPEYARFGEVSPKVDVYSFGVVLFEIISAKQAIVRMPGISANSGASQRDEQRGLVTLFEELLNDADGRDKLPSFVDPALINYPVESVWKMVQLAGACTKENPELRPSMRSAVVALMTLSSTTQDWEMGAFGSASFMTGVMSGR